MSFGPFIANLDPAERIARCRALRALALVFAGPSHRLLTDLAAAEADDTALARAHDELDQLPPLPRRRLLATYAALVDGGRR